MRKIMRAISGKFGKKGQSTVLFATMLPVFVGAASLAIEVGYVQMAKGQMQSMADAAALAGVRELVMDDFAGARNQASTVVASNSVAGKPIGIDPSSDVEFGRWESGAFVSTEAGANAVRVTIRKTAQSSNGALPLFLAPVIGVSNVDVEVSGVATLANIDLMLVIDRSGSMDDDTQYQWQCCWTRVAVGGIQPMDTLRVAAKSFLNDLDAEVDQVGVVSYSSEASSPVEQMLTANFVGAQSAIDDVDQPGGWTHIGDGILKAMGELNSERARGSTVKVIILLSDGAPTCRESGQCGSSTSIGNDGRDYARAMADQANSNNFIIHTISLGSGADRALMQDIAQRTGGGEFFAATGSDLSVVFQQIRERIPVRLVN